MNLLKKILTRKEMQKHDRSYKNPEWDVKESKRYSFKILFANQSIIEGKCKANNLEEIKNMFLKNNCNYLNKHRKITYYNSNEILFLEAERIEDE